PRRAVGHLRTSMVFSPWTSSAAHGCFSDREYGVTIIAPRGRSFAAIVERSRRKQQRGLPTIHEPPPSPPCLFAHNVFCSLFCLIICNFADIISLCSQYVAK